MVVKVRKTFVGCAIRTGLRKSRTADYCEYSFKSDWGKLSTQLVPHEQSREEDSARRITQLVDRSLEIENLFWMNQVIMVKRKQCPEPEIDYYFLFVCFFAVCPGHMILSETAGSITSPFYPRLYPDNQMCSWQITAKQGNRVKLEITDYNIQECGNSNCTCDYLQVQNGFSDDATGKICGVIPHTITYYSLQESLTVLFVSDSTQSKSYDGFKATYQQFNHSPPSK